jgi:hypothetical protein
VGVAAPSALIAEEDDKAIKSAIKPLLAAAQQLRKSRGSQNPRPLDKPNHSHGYAMRL